jgi:hypothetical protein
MQEIFSNSKVYVNARQPSLGLQYLTFFVLFVIVPVGVLLLYYRAFTVVDSKIYHPLVLMVTFAVCIVFILLFIVFSYLRKHWVIKIITDETGVTFHGFLKKIHSHWGDIISIESPSTFLGKNQAEVKTKNGKFFFPFTMKKENQEYPKLVISWDWQWQYRNGNKETPTLENCPLFIEIQKHLGNK